MNRFNLEIDFILRALIWSHSIGTHSATFGQRLLFISYDKKQLYKDYTVYKHFFLNVFLKYICENITFRWTDQRMLQKILSSSENIALICSMLNFFRFLENGKRPSMCDYLLGLDSISMYGNRRREIGYSHMTRELIWGGFMVKSFHILYRQYLVFTI